MSTSTQEQDDHGKSNAQGWYSTICELVAALNCDYDRLEELRDERESLADEVTDADDGIDKETAQGHLTAWDADHGEELAELTAAATVEGQVHDDADTVRDLIQEGPLSVEVRGGWYEPGGDKPEPEEFNILLSTGGPALRIRGELGEHNEPSRAWLEYQDWGTPWTRYFDASQDTLLEYCRCFYFGE